MILFGPLLPVSIGNWIALNYRQARLVGTGRKPVLGGRIWATLILIVREKVGAEETHMSGDANKQLGSARQSAILVGGIATLWVLLFVAHFHSFAIIGDDFQRLTTYFEFPIPEPGDWIASRVVDGFFNGLLFGFFFNYLGPLLPVDHIVDIHAIYANALWASICVAFAMISLSYIKLFIRVGNGMILPFGLCSYVLLFQWVPLTSVTLTVAYTLPYLLALTFLLPIFAYIVHRKDFFSSWPRSTAACAMLLLGYVVFFTIFHAVIFLASAIFVLVSFHIVRNWRIGDIGSRRRFFTALDREPNWFAVAVLISPFLIALNFYYALGSGRWQRAAGVNESRGVELDIGGILATAWDYDTTVSFILGLFAVFGLWVKFSQRRRSDQGALTTERFFLSISLAVAILALFLTALALLTLAGDKLYFDPLHPFVRFALLTVILGVGLRLLSFRMFAPMAAMLFFFMAFHALYLLSQPWGLDTANRKAEIREAVSLFYTFSCYGEELVPLRDEQLLGYPNAPLADSPEWYRNAWSLNLGGYIGNGRPLTATFYHEPDFRIINTRLQELRESRAWLCGQSASDPHYVAVID